MYRSALALLVLGLGACSLTPEQGEAMRGFLGAAGEGVVAAAKLYYPEIFALLAAYKAVTTGGTKRGRRNFGMLVSPKTDVGTKALAARALLVGTDSPGMVPAAEPQEP